jgi:hypothetical protein
MSFSASGNIGIGIQNAMRELKAGDEQRAAQTLQRAMEELADEIIRTVKRDLEQPLQRAGISL